MPLVVGDKEYQITPLSDQASHALTQWVRADLMASAWIAETKLREDPDCVDSGKFRKSIMQAALDVEWSDENGTVVLRSKMGQVRLLMESLRPTFPGITQGIASGILAVEGVADQFWDTFLLVNDLQELDPDDSKKKADKLQSDEAGDLPNGVGSKGKAPD